MVVHVAASQISIAIFSDVLRACVVLQ